MDNAARYYDALKRISMYQSVGKLRLSSEKDWGLSFQEALEYAYENVLEEARAAIRGKGRPKDSLPQRAETPVRRKTKQTPEQLPPDESTVKK
jgi:hypothetical protein